MELKKEFSDNKVDCIFEINNIAQKNFLRKAGTERWDCNDEEFFKKFSKNVDKNKVKSLLQELNFLNEVKPKKKFYEHVLFLGATEFTVRSRINFMFELWNDGVRFNEISFLGSQRPLQKNIEPSYDKIAKYCETENPNEADLIRYVFETSELPKGFEKVKVNHICSKMKKIDGKMVRATTSDTIIDWKFKNPNVTEILAISNQPHINYQHSVIKLILDNCNIETVGRKSKDDKLSIILDGLARYIYCIKESYKKKLNNFQYMKEINLLKTDTENIKSLKFKS